MILYDTILAHAGPASPEGTLSDHSKARLDEAARMFRRGRTGSVSIAAAHNEIIIFDPLKGLTVGDKRQVPYAAPAKEYLIEQGVPERDIQVDDFAIDTVAEVFYFIAGIAAPAGMKNVLSITNHFHKKRVQTISRVATPNEITHRVRGIATEWDTNPLYACQQKSRERASIEVFTRTFGELPKGDFAAFEERLFTTHGLYKNMPPDAQRYIARACTP